MNIVVTGASRGIGFELAKQLAEEGHSVLAISRSEQELGALSESSDQITTLVADITSDDFPSQYKSAIEKFDRIDGLVNNAGYLIAQPFAEMTKAKGEQVMDVNFHAPARIIQLSLGHLSKSDSAHVVNISSMGGVQGASKFPGLSFYSSSKAALIGLTECLAEEYKATKIRFNALSLGAVQTEMLAKAFPGYQAPVSAQQMATYIKDFTLNGHSYINGKNIQVALSTP